MRKLFVLGLVAMSILLTGSVCAVADGVPCQPGEVVNVQVKAAFYELSSKAARSLQLEGAPKGQGVDAREFVVSTVDAAGLKALEARIDKAHPKVINRPILAVPSGLSGNLLISSVLPFKGKDGKEQYARVESGFTAQPTVNEDGSITLEVTLTLPNAPKQIKADAERNVCPGGAMAMITANDGSGKGLVVVFEPAIVRTVGPTRN